MGVTARTTAAGSEPTRLKGQPGEARRVHTQAYSSHPRGGRPRHRQGCSRGPPGGRPALPVFPQRAQREGGPPAPPPSDREACGRPGPGAADRAP